MTIIIIFITSLDSVYFGISETNRKKKVLEQIQLQTNKAFNYRLPQLPPLHVALVLLKLVTPVRVDLAKLGFAWRGARFY